MYEVSNEQMDKIKKVIGQSLEIQNDVFKSLDLNPYDFYEVHDPGEYFNIVLSKEELEDRVKEVQKYPPNYDGFSDERLEELKSGSKITPQEVEAIKESFIEEKRDDDSPVTWAISEITDGSRTVYVFYYEQVWGQGGLNVNDFWGFYTTEEEAVRALDAKDLIEI